MRRFAITVGLSITFGAGLVAHHGPAGIGRLQHRRQVRPPRQRSGVLPAGGQCPASWVRRRHHVHGPAHQHDLRPPDRDRRRLPLHGLRRGRRLVDEGPDRSGARGRLSLGLSHPRGPPLRGRELGRGHGRRARGSLQLVARHRRRCLEVVLDAHRGRRRHRLRRAQPQPARRLGAVRHGLRLQLTAASASSSGPWRRTGSTKRPHGSRPGATWCSSTSTRRSPAAGPGCSTGSAT